MASRLGLSQQATRKSLYARLMLAGPSGSGKSLTALYLAEALSPGGKHLVIDTERGEALNYAPNPLDPNDPNDVPFTHLDWRPPYDATEFCATVGEASGEFDTLITDSFSHFWSKEGGILDVADGRFTNWKDARPLQERTVEAIKGFRGHVILCVRAKTEYVQEAVEDKGKIKQVVRKVGMSPVQDPNLEYELNVALDLDLQHRLFVSKSRAYSVPVGRTYGPGRDEVIKFATEYGHFLSGGDPLLTRDEVAAVRAQIASSMTPAQIAWAKEEWVRRGIPKVDMMTQGDMVRVHALMDDARQQIGVQEGAGAA